MKPIMRRVSESSQLDRDNPWPGLDSYDESSHDFFSGRTEETNELLRRILDEPITVLFGKSGLGKTSLLKAGVFPRLREKGILPILVRLQIRITTEPLIEQVRLAFLDELRTQGIEHRDPEPGESLWEYMHRAGQEFWTRQNRLTRPVFIFDQFEELFTLGRGIPAAVAAFREDLADLAENRIPAAVARKLENRGASEVRLDLQTMAYKIAISLREDFLADLEEWRVTMPSLRRNRMRILPMGQTQALQAVFNERTGHIVSKPLAQKIVAFLSAGTGSENESVDGAGATVEPALLSLFCRGVNEHRKRDGKVSLDEALIEGAKGTIVLDFYRSSISDQPDRVRRFIEEELITEHGFRNSYSVNDAIAQEFVTASELGTLIDRHLLRHEHHLGTERVELTHDLLTRAVVDERDIRRSVELGEQRRRQARQRKKRTLLRIVVPACVIVAVVFAGLAYFAVKSRTEAVNAMGELAAGNTKLQKTSSDLALAKIKADEQTILARGETARASRESDQSRSRELAAMSRMVAGKDPHLAILLALEGLRRSETTEARSSLLDATQYAWPLALLNKEQVGGTPNAIVLSPDGNRLTILAGGQNVSLWDISSGKPTPVGKGKIVLERALSLAASPDQKLIAVGRTKGIDLLDAATGGVQEHLPQPENYERRIVFSADSQWLASTQEDGQLQLLDYRGGGALPPVPATLFRDVLDFSVLAGGKTIIGVDYSLIAYSLELQDGKWSRTEKQLIDCVKKPQSVSPGTEYFSATWKARTCTFPATTKERFQQSEIASEDIIWSPAGRAFTELLASEDLIVGRIGSRGRPWVEGRINGAHPNLKEDNKTQSVTVNESATRVALIDEHGVIRVYSLAAQKQFLSRFEESSLALSPDGDWMAVAQRLPMGKAGVDILRLHPTSAPGLPSPTRVHIDIPDLPVRINATRDTVVIQLPGDKLTTSVFSASTGKHLSDQPGGLQPRPVPVREKGSTASPLGGFDLKLVTEKDSSLHTSFKVIRRADNSILKVLKSNGLQHRFSRDDRWLATWGEQGVEVLDLTRGETVFNLSYDDVEDIEFIARNNILAVYFADDAIQLIPLDRTLMELFAKKLATRELTSEERCTYGLGGTECRTEHVTVE